MKRLSILTLVCLFAGCETERYAPPPVTAQMATIGAKQRVDLATLHEGRTVFVSRCIECHVLPAVTKHTAADWPHTVDTMSERASLSKEQRDALVAYLTVARAR